MKPGKDQRDSQSRETNAAHTSAPAGLRAVSYLVLGCLSALLSLNVTWSVGLSSVLGLAAFSALIWNDPDLNPFSVAEIPTESLSENFLPHAVRREDLWSARLRGDPFREKSNSDLLQVLDPDWLEVIASGEILKHSKIWIEQQKPRRSSNVAVYIRATAGSEFYSLKPELQCTVSELDEDTKGTCGWWSPRVGFGGASPKPEIRGTIECPADFALQDGRDITFELALTLGEGHRISYAFSVSPVELAGSDRIAGGDLGRRHGESK